MEGETGTGEAVRSEKRVNWVIEKSFAVAETKANAVQLQTFFADPVTRLVTPPETNFSWIQKLSKTHATTTGRNRTIPQNP
ncbi:hypothetical protein RRSWK_05650 [Rhodopirellula sp. SWK7]|nr:hypothetical protein RRSWK_05650 [Rhodopirellula sp. SWK7]